MRLKDYLKQYSIIALVGLLGACQSAADTGLGNQPPLQHSAALKGQPIAIGYGTSKQSQSPDSDQEQLKLKIVEQVSAQQTELNICENFLNLEQAKAGSQLYVIGPNQYLVQLLCFQAAYQGSYEFLVADHQAELSLRPLDLSLAGYPSYDPKTQVLSNDYKFRGIGDCIESTEHRWSGQDLVLLTSELVETVPNSCEIFKGGEAYVITSSQIGLAKLGMTLAELKMAMGEEAHFAPTALGVDLGSGMAVSKYGDLQFEVGSGSESPMTDESVITWIRVQNPIYKTKEGVGPGTSLKRAIAKYGPASLALNIENESREFVTFETGFPQNVLIQSNQWALDGEAGLYPAPQDGYRTTTTFKDKAAIGSITITLR